MSAQDLKLVPPGYCPTCRQRLEPRNTPKRVCGTCNKPILKGHKFVFDGSTVRHRVCGEPDSYQPSTKEDETS
jgi:hypothetical protein